MSEQDDETAMLETILTTPTAQAFRDFVRDGLDLRPGESVLSVGCGPGFEPAAFATDVGDDGRVHGVDVNEDTLETARERCADLPQVSFERGDATDLPVPDDSYDAAVAKQVYQFVPDVAAAVDELARVLEPGGRAVVLEKDLDSRVFHSSDRDRMQRSLETYRNTVRHPHLGSRLPAMLQDAGLVVEDVEPKATVHTEINDRVERGLAVQRDFMADDDAFDEDEIDAWERDLRALDDAGRFLFCGTQFRYRARKPA